MEAPATRLPYFREAEASGLTTASGRPTGAARRGIVLVGAGGFGREVLQYVTDALRLQSGYIVKGFLDDGPGDGWKATDGPPVLGNTEGYRFEPNDRVIIAIGDPSSRLKVAARLEARHARFLTIVHPLAYVADTASIGVGCIVAPFATIGAEASIGDHTFLTFYSSVAHHAIVGRACGFSPHSVTNGGSVLGDGVFLGTYAVVNPLQSVGDGAKLAAGAVVYHPIPPRVLAVGNPAKPRPLWQS